MTIGIALLGAGIFAREEHLPAIAACDKLSLVAVYSRSKASADAFAAAAAAVLGADQPTPETYYDEPATAGRGLDDLLARTDVAAVSVCLPIAQQAPTVRRALAAGKHVLSEKPVADTVAHATALLAEYEAASASASAAAPLWAVAENYRFHTSLQQAADRLRALGGALVSFELRVAKFTRPDSKYYNTPWRKTPTHPGGFLLDGGVHFVAALRALLAAAPDTVWQPGGAAVTAASGTNNTITKVAAALTQLQPQLPPCDTVRALAVTRGGASGLLSISFGTEFSPPAAGPDLVSVTTTEACVSWGWDGFTVVRRGDGAAGSSSPVVERTDCAADPATFPPKARSGVLYEVAAFAQSIANGGRAAADPRQTPAEALEDLRLVEALFDAGKSPLAVQEIA